MLKSYDLMKRLDYLKNSGKVEENRGKGNVDTTYDKKTIEYMNAQGLAFQEEHKKNCYDI
jgi:hypothetical protein